MEEQALKFVEYWNKRLIFDFLKSITSHVTLNRWRKKNPGSPGAAVLSPQRTGTICGDSLQHLAPQRPFKRVPSGELPTDGRPLAVGNPPADRNCRHSRLEWEWNEHRKQCSPSEFCSVGALLEVVLVQIATGIGSKSIRGPGTNVIEKRSRWAHADMSLFSEGCAFREILELRIRVDRGRSQSLFEEQRFFEFCLVFLFIGIEAGDDSFWGLPRLMLFQMAYLSDSNF